MDETVAVVAERLRGAATEIVDQAVERIRNEATAVVNRAVTEHGERLARSAGASAADRLEQIARRDPEMVRSLARSAGEGAANKVGPAVWTGAISLAALAATAMTALVVSYRRRRGSRWPR